MSVLPSSGVSRESVRLPAGAIAVVARHPTLWSPAVRFAIRFAPDGWWQRPPFLPIPDARYWAFRMETAYGDASASPDHEDVAEMLRWARRTHTAQR